MLRHVKVTLTSMRQFYSYHKGPMMDLKVWAHDHLQRIPCGIFLNADFPFHARYSESETLWWVPEI